MTARDRLNAQLLDVIDGRHWIPCALTGWATSDDAHERAQAAADCLRCPLLDPCRDVGTEERQKFGVWGGIDRTPTARKPGRPRRATT